MTKLKRLPRDKDGQMKRTFTAGGRKNIIRTYEEGVSIERFRIFQTLSPQVGFGLDFQRLYDNLTEALQMSEGIRKDERELYELIIHLGAIRAGITKHSEQRNTFSLYLCSLFIVWEDEDLTKWSKAEADEKIQTWADEGYDVRDFLALALGSVKGFATAYKDLIGRLTEQAIASTALFGESGNFPKAEQQKREKKNTEQETMS